MKVKYIGGEKMDFLVKDNQIGDLVNGKVYSARPSKKHPEYFYLVTDESGEEYAYPKNFFEVVEE